MKGLVHIYTGSGKGKTTAAIGLGVRACGRGLRVHMVQFLKGMLTGEVCSLKRLEPEFTLYRGTEIKKFTWDMTEEERKVARRQQEDILAHAADTAFSGGCDLLILDEVLGAISSGMIDLKAVTDFIRSKPEGMELVLTGRDAPPELVCMADYVSDINAVKHPMEKGIPARKGIEC